jgi:hypothetical protein
VGQSSCCNSAIQVCSLQQFEKCLSTGVMHEVAMLDDHRNFTLLVPREFTYRQPEETLCLG